MRVLVFGTFDHLHLGHRFLLGRAREYGELFVVVAHERTVKLVKGFSPDQSQHARGQAIREAYPSATILYGSAKDYLAPVRRAKPDLILFGYDQSFPPGIGEKDLPCPVERIEAFHPGKYKSSLLKKSARRKTLARKAKSAILTGNIHTKCPQKRALKGRKAKSRKPLFCGSSQGRS